MAVDMAIKNCKIVFPEGIISGAGVAVDGEKIVAVVKEPNLPKADKTIDAKGNYLIPGVIETHTHLSYGSMDLYRSQVKSETGAAACGGVTTFFTKLPRQGLMVPIEELKKSTEGNAIVDMSFHIGIGTMEHVKEIPRYAELGLTSFKFHMYAHSVVGVHRAEDDVIWRTFEVTSDLIRKGYPCIIQFHAQNQRICEAIAHRLQEEGRTDIDAWYESQPSLNEEEGMRRVIYFAEQFGNVPIYFVHMSIGDGVRIVAKAKARGLKVITETEPQFLTHTKHDFPDYIVGFAFREKEDNEKLWRGIRDGWVETIGTDHEVSFKKDILERKGESIWKEWLGGVPPGSETMLPVMLSEGVNKGRISFERLVEVMCLNPAKTFSIFPKKGTFHLGSDADLVIVDLKKERVVTPEILHSAGDYSFYEGWKLKGWPVMTICRGNVVMAEGEIVGKPGFGEAIFRKRDSKWLQEIPRPSS